MGKLPLALALAGLLLPLSGCQETPAATLEATIQLPQEPPVPTSFHLACDGIFMDFTARTEDVQATLPPGYVAADITFGTDWVSLTAGHCDIEWNDLEWEDVPLAWTKTILDDAINASTGFDFYTYEWLADTKRATEFFDWLSSLGWPVADAAIVQDAVGYRVTAAGLQYTIDAGNVHAIPPGVMGFGGGRKAREHHADLTTMAFDVEDNQAKVLLEGLALLTAEGGVLSRLGPFGMSPTGHPVDRFFVLQEWDFTFRLLQPDQAIEPIRT